MPDYSEYAVYEEWILWLLAACALAVAVAALVLAMTRSSLARVAGGFGLVLAVATIAAGLVLTRARQADCERDEKNRAWAMRGGHVWHDEQCPVEARGSTVLAIELAALPLLVAAGALRRARPKGAKRSTA